MKIYKHTVSERTKNQERRKMREWKDSCNIIRIRKYPVSLSSITGRDMLSTTSKNACIGTSLTLTQLFSLDIFSWSTRMPDNTKDGLICAAK